MLKALSRMRFDPMALIVSFCIANLASWIIKAETASLMVVPTMLILMHARSITRVFTLLIYLGVSTALFYHCPDAFYVLVIYSVFYLALVMKSQFERSLVLDVKRRLKEKN